jgi:Tol biopolymer transport system component
MSLSPGSRLGSYEVIEAIGAGGMGEVYRAKDTCLKRTVAIKVLPDSVSTDPDRLVRFQREAEVLASLNHPNIAQVFGLEKSTATTALVMELVEGPTLADRIAHGPIPLEQALPIAKQIADALEAAHEQGVIHRDLKPANIKVRPDGTVKVLDFGLAKALEPKVLSAGRDNSPTITSPAMTQAGVILGTTAYMSPEQARGQPVDKRTDIWAFGCVLFEMLTGRPAFGGRTATDSLARILEREPEWTTVPVSTPAGVRRLLKRCLTKDFKRRFHDISDAKLELEDPWDTDAGATESGRTAARSLTVPGNASTRRTQRALVVAAAVAVFVAGGWWLSQRMRGALPAPLVVPLTTFTNGRASFASFSPDGKEVVFTWNGDKASEIEHLWVQLIGSETPVQLTAASADDTSPVWSPDGSRIAFFRREGERDVLYFVSRLGGSEMRVADFAPATWALSEQGPNVFSNPVLTWSPDARWLVVGGRRATADNGLVVISADGGTRRLLLAAPETSHYESPTFSSAGDALAFADCNGASSLFCRVHVLRLNPTTLAPVGGPARVTNEFEVIAGIAWTEDSQSLIYGAASVWLNTFHLWRVPRSGNRAPERVEVAGVGALPSISKAGHRLAYSRRNFDLNIWRWVAGNTLKPIVPSVFSDYDAFFSGDGTKIAFVTDRRGEGSEVWTANADGTQPTSLTSGTQRTLGSPRWSPNGQTLAFDGKGDDGKWHVSVIDARGGQPRRLRSGPSSENLPSWAKDGASVYVGSDPAGLNRDEIWRVRINDGRSEQITRSSGSAPLESPDGKVLYFTRSGKLFAMNLPDGPERLILPSVLGWAYWPEQNGVYYVPVPEPGEPPGSLGLLFLDFHDGRSRLLTTLSFQYFQPALNVSPDGKTVLLTGVTRIGVNLMLIENFH